MSQASAGLRSVLLLSGREVAEILDPTSCLAAVERAFGLLGEGKALRPALCGLHAGDGGFHVKAAVLADEEGHPYFAAKVNANFPDNPERWGLPTVQGAVLLMDGACGAPLAVLDSAVLTALRTAAATAVAAKHLARPDSAVLTLCGCGVQGRAHLAFLAAVLPLRRVWLADRDPSAVDRCAAEAARLGLEVQRASDARAACRESDLCVTCTPGREEILGADDVRPGAFVAGVGADSESKRELAPDLLGRSKVVADLAEQCARIGDLHHALAAGALTAGDVYAELGDVVAGHKPGRTSPDEIIVFDSTGMALQDVAAAIVTYRRAVAAGRGVRVVLS
jgi:ornithine cyclodeaminase/alanine dehydrogenase-like protein (mu-crystallin family)